MREYSFLELKAKEVVNIADGRSLGHICDIEFTCFGKVLGIVVPGTKRFFKNLAASDSIYIPWKRITKVGSDVILVELIGSSAKILQTAGGGDDEMLSEGGFEE
ncbi:MAG: YlmC/YmxH family sporulation protein [Clostridiaceae bacterium]|jgi:YlmC/YmxH family sporulation protein|nr:YlmC/YmxH family sporulation protein [Clostridiaceae bacterium]